jgi:CrcB protein
MNDYLLIAVGGAAGSVGRYALAQNIDVRLGWSPWGTLLVNVLGCFAIGIAAGYTDRSWVRPLVMVGVLGGFTTFSSFGLQTVTLLQQGDTGKALLYVGLSLALCLLAVWGGLTLKG